MKYYVIFGLILGIAFNLSAQEENAPLDPLKCWELTEAKWEVFQEMDKMFKISTPGVFQEKIDSVSTAIGIIVAHTFYFQPDVENAENEMYMLMVTDYPLGALPKDSTDLLNSFLEETEASATEVVLGELMFSQQGSMDDFPYRYWRIDYLNGRASIRTKAVLVGHRLYTVQTVTRREYGINHSTDRFIDSFRFFKPSGKG